MNKKLNTVNVIEIVARAISQVISFKDDKQGNQQAEKLFTKIAISNGCKKIDTDYYIEQGCYEEGNYQVNIVHSS